MTFLNLSKLQDLFTQWIASLLGLSNEIASALATVLSIALLVVLAFIVDRFIQRLISWLVPRIVRRLKSETPREWESALHQRMVVKRGAHLVGILFFYWIVPYATKDFPGVLRILRNGVEGFLVIAGILVLTSFLSASKDVWGRTKLKIGVPIRFASQAVQILVWVFGGILALSVTFDQSVTVLLSGMAGMTAILALVFRDTILGFVAGIQLSSNDMLRIGDWIEVPQYGADGTVEEVALTTVKVRNFDKTISTIPSYSLVSQSFKNWRGMHDFAARRIKRSVHLDMNFIQFLTEDDVNQLKTVKVLRGDWIAIGKSDNHDKDKVGTTDAVIDVPTNLSLFGDYLRHYLNHHPEISHDNMVMVRQLEPGEYGLPVQIYCFCADIQWLHYEDIQFEIMDHVLSVLPYFKLKPFQLETDRMPAERKD